MTDKKIALIKGAERYDNYGDSSELIAQHITEWTTITEEEYNLLIQYQYSVLRGYTIIEQPLNQKEIVEMAVKSAINLAKKMEKEAKDRKEAEAKRRAEAAAKKEEKRLMKDRQALENLVKANPDLVKDLLNK